jgi:hypothetical protein
MAPWSAIKWPRGPQKMEVSMPKNRPADVDGLANVVVVVDDTPSSCPLCSSPAYRVGKGKSGDLFSCRPCGLTFSVVSTGPPRSPLESGTQAGNDEDACAKQKAPGLAPRSLSVDSGRRDITLAPSPSRRLDMESVYNDLTRQEHTSTSADGPN